MTKTTCINNEFLGNLSVNTSTSARDISLTIENTDNTNSASHAKLLITTGGASSGDAKLEFKNTGVNYLTLGLDNSDSDAFKIAASEELETSTVFASHSGYITRPLQPAFFVYQDAVINDITGNGATYSLIFDTVVFDIGSNYSTGTGIYTAPESGKYFFSTTSGFGACTTTAIGLYIVTSSYSYDSNFSRTSAGNWQSTHVSTITPLDAGDTVHIDLYGSGAAANTCDLNIAPAFCWFSGILLN